MITKLAAHAALYITALYLSLYAVTSGNAQCIENGISTNISSDLVREGGSVTLSCYVSGTRGQSSTSWVNPADDLLSVDAAISGSVSSRFTVSANNADPDCMVYNLTITNLTMADAGSYSCRPTADMNPMSSEVVDFGYIPGPAYPECKVAGGSTLVMAGDVLEFICETEPGAPVWDLTFESSQYGTNATAPTTSTTINSELKSITSTLNVTADENGKIMSCIATCPDPMCVDTVERNCTFGQILVVENPVDEYFFVTTPLVHVTMGSNVSIECKTTLPGTELQWFLHETLTENYVTETTSTGQSSTIYITDITNKTVANPFVCSLSMDGSIISTKKASLTFDSPPTTVMPTTVATTGMMTTGALPPMNVTATPSMLVNMTSQAPMNTTSEPGNATTTLSFTNVTATEGFVNTTSGTTAGPTANATAAATTPPQATTSQAPLLQTNTTQPITQEPQNTTLPSTTMLDATNTTSGSENTTGSEAPFNPTIVQRTMTTLQWWQPRTTLFPQETMFPQQPTNVQPNEPATGTPSTPAASGPGNAVASFFTLPIIMGIASVGGLLLIFIVTAIVCVLTSKKRRGGAHDVEELTELSKRNSKPIRLDPFEVPSNRATESDPTFAAFGKGTSTQDLINIGDDSPSNAQQNGSNNTGRGKTGNGSADTRPLTANDLLNSGLDNHGISDSIL